jgi:hypothetical protein
MLARLAALCAACLSLPASALADRFYLGSAETEQKMAAGTADYIDGVLLRRENGNYVIRIKGGEITVPESAVYKIEQIALTADDVAQQEKADEPRLARAEEARRAFLVELEQRRQNEAAARRDAAAVAAHAPEAQPAAHGGYDAVLDVYHAQYPPWTPVTPDRADRGLSRYLDAQEHFERTRH